MKDRFGNEVKVGSKIALAARRGNSSELKIREIIEADPTKPFAVYMTEGAVRRRELLLQTEDDRWVVLGGASG